MRLLRRSTLYTEQQSDEVRLNQLERRIMSVPTDWAFVEATAAQAVSSGGTILVWNNFRTTNQQVFSTSATLGGARSNTTGDEAIRLDTTGVVMVAATVRFESGTFYRSIAINVGGGETDAISNIPDITSSQARGAASVDSGSEVLAFSDEQWFACSDDSFASWFSVQANVQGADQDATHASLTVALFSPSGVPWDDTEVY